MRSNKPKQRITIREMDVLKILFSAKTPLIATEILKRNDDLNMNTVQSVLRSLLQKQFIEVDNVVYSGTVLSRSYRPTELSIANIMESIYETIALAKNFMPAVEIYTTILDNEKDVNVLDALQIILCEKRRLTQQETPKSE